MVGLVSAKRSAAGRSARRLSSVAAVGRGRKAPVNAAADRASKRRLERSGIGMSGNPCVEPWLAGYEQWISQSTRVAWLRTAMWRDAGFRVGH